MRFVNSFLNEVIFNYNRIEDLVSIIHYFIIKTYPRKRKLNKIRKELEEDEKKERESHNNED